MKRVIVTAVLLAGALAFAGPDAGELELAQLDAGVALDAPVEHEGKIEIIEVHDGVIRSVSGVVEQVTGGAYLPHTSLIEVAQKMARLEGENLALRVLIGVTMALTVGAIAAAAYEWAQEHLKP